MCKETPHFDRTRNVRIDLPPCCREKLMAVTRFVINDFNRLEIPYMLFSGAVLGWMRNRKFVPYDQDIDIWMDSRYWNTRQFNELRRNWTTKFGLYTEYRDERQKLWTFFSDTNLQGLDIWPWYVDEENSDGTFRKSSHSRSVEGYPHGTLRKPLNALDDTSTYNQMSYDEDVVEYESSSERMVRLGDVFEGKWACPYDTIFPRKRVEFEGMVTYLPNKPSEYNRITYGENWKEEMTCTKTNEDRKCTE